MYQSTGIPTKLELNKICLEALTLYAHGLISLTELSGRLSVEDVSISHVTTTFTSECLTISTGIKQTDLYFHLTKFSGEKDERGFPINDEACVVNL
ncbi:hypothetical protein HOU08_gp279 [Dickeya phage vB_DsoM_JA29]|uniref:Uncharacterized protein n=1 Tax=Dickeya phage vB_DsoM_JA29 TaxID=2283031 RepID=A0A384ZXQ6_9CAUD|nr:hypothetical protein HOU08_gp279 [Dickeya phage vB_DsoM_JA29]AXG67005.1 hypothetical protein JA29_279 [Dickeya phage vB_DsoM_JA29]